MNKKLLLCSVFSAALLLGAGILNAKDVALDTDTAPKAEFVKHHKDFKGKHEHKPLEDKLGLSDEQKEQAKKIHEQGLKEMEPLMKEMKDLREKMDSVRKNNMEEFEKILTPEQKTKLEEMKKQIDGKMKEFKDKHGKMRGPRHLEHGDFPPPPHGDGNLPPLPQGDTPATK